jgi:ubiquinone biosynthesis protein
VDFGIVGRLDPLARRYLAEILYGLLTRNYHRVAQIHIEARYIPAHYTLEEFATALRAVGEPILGKPIKEISVGRLLEQLFAITRVFEMPTQPHLLLLQKTMVMVEGFAATLDPDANMWELAEPFVARWIREELGPEAKAARFIQQGIKNLQRLPRLLERLEDTLPVKGAAPPGPPLPALPKPMLPKTGRVLVLLLAGGVIFGAGIILGQLI